MQTAISRRGLSAIAAVAHSIYGGEQLRYTNADVLMKEPRETISEIGLAARGQDGERGARPAPGRARAVPSATPPAGPGCARWCRKGGKRAERAAAGKVPGRARNLSSQRR